MCLAGADGKRNDPPECRLTSIPLRRRVGKKDPPLKWAPPPPARPLIKRSCRPSPVARPASINIHPKVPPSVPQQGNAVRKLMASE
ncbi:Hypothetical protein NTJ_08893 [Nesidiocoris tenuis]|uniref:Uncharacterized protein n=1 Tax=Nesidiocoris tenuis TaxID=355587 RepID=A0ABN7AV62_9HEMI|nr:Hypothetical protein NTJ_08893 [Nesidiocoris tenuis]